MRLNSVCLGYKNRFSDTTNEKLSIMQNKRSARSFCCLKKRIENNGLINSFCIESVRFRNSKGQTRMIRDAQTSLTRLTIADATLKRYREVTQAWGDIYRKALQYNKIVYSGL